MGAALVYFFFTPMVMWFFLSMQQSGTDDQVQISLLPKVSEYLSLIMTLIFSFGLVFQLPVVTTLMARVGLLSSQALKEKRKWAIVHRLHRRRGADAARSDQPDQPRHARPSSSTRSRSGRARLIEKKREEERVAREKEDEAATVSAHDLAFAA